MNTSRPEDLNDQIAAGTAQRELARLAGVKLELGTENHAEEIGHALVSNQVAMMNPDLQPTAELVIKGMRTDLEAIAKDPVLATKFAAGVIAELRDRQFFSYPISH